MWTLARSAVCCSFMLLCVNLHVIPSHLCSCRRILHAFPAYEKKLAIGSRVHECWVCSNGDCGPRIVRRLLLAPHQRVPQQVQRLPVQVLAALVTQIQKLIYVSFTYSFYVSFTYSFYESFTYSLHANMTSIPIILLIQLSLQVSTRPRAPPAANTSQSQLPARSELPRRRLVASVLPFVTPLFFPFSFIPVPCLTLVLLIHVPLAVSTLSHTWPLSLSLYARRQFTSIQFAGSFTHNHPTFFSLLPFFPFILLIPSKAHTLCLYVNAVSKPCTCKPR